MDLQESLPDIPEPGFRGEITQVVQTLEITSNSEPNNIVTESDNLVNTFKDPEPNICNQCKLILTLPPRKLLGAQTVI